MTSGGWTTKGSLGNVQGGREMVRGFVFENIVIGGSGRSRWKLFAPLDQRNVEDVVFR